MAESYVCVNLYFFFFKQKSAYEIRQCDWSSDVCSSDLSLPPRSDPGYDAAAAEALLEGANVGDRKSVVLGKSVRSCVDLGGRCIIKKKKRLDAPPAATMGRVLQLMAALSSN